VDSVMSAGNLAGNLRKLSLFNQAHSIKAHGDPRNFFGVKAGASGLSHRSPVREHHDGEVVWKKDIREKIIMCPHVALLLTVAPKRTPLRRAFNYIC
jgi:hypothetical protein